MPIRKKYLDRDDLLLELSDVELTEYANNYLKSIGVENQEVLVLVANDHDPVFSFARGAMIYNLVDKLVILLQRDFIKNYSREIVKPLIMHEIGHFINHDNFVRFTIPRLFIACQYVFPAIIFLILCLMVFQYGFNILLPLLSITFFVVQNLIFNFLYARFCRKNEFLADQFAAKQCGKEETILMLSALKDLVGLEQAGLFTIHPLISERKNAIKSLKI
jgi:Zn-dependent protease with chaperone function